MSLYAAIREGEKRRSEYITLEHLLYALSFDPKTKQTLLACGVNLKKLRKDLAEFMDESIGKIPDEDENTPIQSVSFQRVLQRAFLQARSAGKAEIHGGNIIAAMFAETDSHAVYCLESQGVTRLDIVNHISHGIVKFERGEELEDEDEAFANKEEDENDDEEAGPAKDPLSAYMVNLNERAREGKIDPLIGRLEEVERIVQVLSRRRKNNPLLVGDPGVGKTAIVEGLARLIVEKKVPDVLLDAEIFALDMGSLIAGTKFRGQFEERLKASLRALAKREHAILFIDEIHTVIGAGATSGGTMDASNLLKPALASGELRCVGSTTHEDYRRSFNKDPALRRRFQKIDIGEPSVEDTIEILKGLQPSYEKFHDVTYTDEAIESAARLSSRHILERYLPDKAIDVIDETGARNRVRKAEDRVEVIGLQEVEAVVAKIGRMPEINAGDTERDRLAKLESNMKAKVFGQDEAIASICGLVKLNRAGLGSPDKPVGNFLFVGPTGVGKTEVAKQLAAALAIEFIRFDMSEYQEAHSISRLIGAPPGYVGYDNGGLLTEAVRKHPHAVLLLDEIEKAHPNLYDVLLQVMDAASLTDNNGRVADFRNVFIIMTSNAGAREMGKNVIGFGATLDVSRSLKAVERTFSPEFRNRLDKIVVFAPLSRETMGFIVTKFIGDLSKQLAERDVTLEVTDEARAWLAVEGHDELNGARPLHRVIQTEIKMQVADVILFGALVNGGALKVGKAEKGAKSPLTFEFTAKESEA